MSFDEREKALALVLKNDIDLLKKSSVVLMYSYDQCKDLAEKIQRSPEEEEAMEALTARFSRTSDLLTQKIIKTILILLKEDISTFIDRVHFLEKMEVIDDAESLIRIRSLRNEIAHEYSSDLHHVFVGVMHYTPLLKKTADNILLYLETSSYLRGLIQ